MGPGFLAGASVGGAGNSFQVAGGWEFRGSAVSGVFSVVAPVSFFVLVV